MHLLLLINVKSKTCNMGIICLLDLVLFQTEGLCCKIQTPSYSGESLLPGVYLVRPLLCCGALYISSSWQPLWSSLLYFCHKSASLRSWLKIILSVPSHKCLPSLSYFLHPSCPKSSNFSRSYLSCKHKIDQWRYLHWGVNAQTWLRNFVA